MAADRRDNTREAPEQQALSAVLIIGEDRFKAEMLDQSNTGSSMLISLPRRRLGAEGFTDERDCFLFGEIGRLVIGNRIAYEVQILNINPREPEQGKPIHKGKAQLRLGTRIIREVPLSHTRTPGSALRVGASLVLALIFSGYCTARALSDQLPSLPAAPTIQWPQLQFAGLWEADAPKPVWRERDVTQAQARGFVVPGTDAMHRFKAQLSGKPTLARVEQLLVLRDPHFIHGLQLDEWQHKALFQLMLEAEAEMNRLWHQFQNHQEIFHEHLADFIEMIEVRVLAHLTPEQAQAWVSLAG